MYERQQRMSVQVWLFTLDQHCCWLGPEGLPYIDWADECAGLVYIGSALLLLEQGLQSVRSQGEDIYRDHHHHVTH
jgi:hypothetical protein